MTQTVGFYFYKEADVKKKAGQRFFKNDDAQIEKNKIRKSERN